MTMIANAARANKRARNTVLINIALLLALGRPWGLGETPETLQQVSLPVLRLGVVHKGQLWMRRLEEGMELVKASLSMEASTISFASDVAHSVAVADADATTPVVSSVAASAIVSTP